MIFVAGVQNSIQRIKDPHGVMHLASGVDQETHVSQRQQLELGVPDLRKLLLSYCALLPRWSARRLSALGVHTTTCQEFE